MVTGLQAFLMIALFMGIIYVPALVICVHFALKKQGNAISGLLKKTMLGIIGYLLWVPCFFTGSIVIGRGLFYDRFPYESVV